MERNQESTPNKETINEAVQNLSENRHQNLANENLGNEPEEQPEGDPDNPYRMEGLDDKRPADDQIEKGWTIDSSPSDPPKN